MEADILLHCLNKLEQTKAVLQTIDCVVADDVDESIRQLRAVIEQERRAA